MLSIIALLCLLGALVLLIALSVIDLKIKLLPNELVLGFATLGIVFHLTTLNKVLPMTDIAFGALAGFSVLYLIRLAANAYYKQDALGLGDTKLMAAAGIWLGLEGVLTAIWVGAIAGLVHGLAYAAYIAFKDKTPMTISRLAIPAGPGFAIGIVIVGFMTFKPYVMEVIHGFFA